MGDPEKSPRCCRVQVNVLFLLFQSRRRLASYNRFSTSDHRSDGIDAACQISQPQEPRDTAQTVLAGGCACWLCTPALQAGFVHHLDSTLCRWLAGMQKHVNENALQAWFERLDCSDEVTYWKEFYCEGSCCGVSEYSTNRLQTVVAAVENFGIKSQYHSTHP